MMFTHRSLSASMSLISQLQPVQYV